MKLPSLKQESGAGTCPLLEERNDRNDCVPHLPVSSGIGARVCGILALWKRKLVAAYGVIVRAGHHVRLDLDLGAS